MYHRCNTVQHKGRVLPALYHNHMIIIIVTIMMLYGKNTLLIEEVGCPNDSAVRLGLVDGPATWTDPGPNTDQNTLIETWLGVFQ